MLSKQQLPAKTSDNRLTQPPVQSVPYRTPETEMIHKRHKEEDKENRTPMWKRSRTESSSDNDSETGDDKSESESETESEEEEFFSDDEPDEEVLGVVAELQKRWAAQRRLAEESESSTITQVPRPKTPVVFGFDEQLPDVTLGPVSVPLKETIDGSHHIREPELIAQGQPEGIIDFPDLMAYVNANKDRMTSHE